MFLSAPKELSLNHVDDFLRFEWCECCGHTSSFYGGNRYNEIEMDMTMVGFQVGDYFRYEYDFDVTTTTIKLTVIDEILSEKMAVMLLAKNEMPEHKCTFCGDGADHINIEQYVTFACDQCFKKEENDEIEWLPTVNSPRMGICEYKVDGVIDLKLPFRVNDEDDDSGSGRYSNNWEENAKLIADDFDSAFDLFNLSDDDLLDIQKELLAPMSLPSLEELREEDGVDLFLAECEEMKPMSEDEMMQFIEDGDFDLNSYAKHLSEIVEIFNGLTPDEAEGFDLSEIYNSYELVQRNQHLFAKDDGLSKRSERVSKLMQLFGGDEDFD